MKFCDNVVQKTEACAIEPVQNVEQNIVKPYIPENTFVEQARGNGQNSVDPNLSIDDANITCRKSARKPAKPVYLKDYVTMVDAPTDQNIDFLYQMGDFETPKTFEEAIQSENSMKWHQAMKDEISALDENETFEYTKLPAGANLIGENGSVLSKEIQMVRKDTRLDM